MVLCVEALPTRRRVRQDQLSMQNNDLELMSCEELKQLILRQLEAKNTAQCGRRVCAWCVPQRDLGPAHELCCGDVTHGICKECSAAILGEFNSRS